MRSAGRLISRSPPLNDGYRPAAYLGVAASVFHPRQAPASTLCEISARARTQNEGIHTACAVGSRGGSPRPGDRSSGKLGFVGKRVCADRPTVNYGPGMAAMPPLGYSMEVVKGVAHWG
jgi:hypothetical protein